MNLIRPEKLNKGDTIGFLSVAGVVEDMRFVEKAKEYFQNKGYKVKLSSNLTSNCRYLSGTDEERLNALYEMYTNESVKAVIAVRGGYGSLRLINKIDYSIIKNNPKLFAGFSDITALSLMFYKKTGLMTFQGPMILSDFSCDIDKFTEKSFFENLETDVNEIVLSSDSKVYFEGCSKGVLWGGNLATIASLAGIDFVPEDKFILFIEDVNEPVYKIDRMLTQLLNIEDFKKNLSGILIGDFSGVDSEKDFDDLFYEIGNTLKIPVKSGLKFGHVKEKMTLPIGAACTFDTCSDIIKLQTA